MSAKGPHPPPFFTLAYVQWLFQKSLEVIRIACTFQVSASETVFTEGYSVSILAIKVINFF